VAVERITSSRAKIKYYEAGMDLGLSDNKITSFRLFQQLIVDEYEGMVPEFNLTKIDGTLPVQKQQKLVRQVVKSVLKDWRGLVDPFPVLQQVETELSTEDDSLLTDGGAA
jgi:dTMP kinase